MPSNPTPAEGVVVPLEATMTMQNAAWGALAKQGFAIEDVEVQPIWQAMLAARPAAPTQSAAQTGEEDAEATDLVARLRDVPEMLRWYGDLGTGRIVAAETLTEAATLIEAQAAEIEGFKAWVSDALAVLTTIAGAETPPQQHGHYLAHRTAVKAARTFLASRTERVDG